MLANYLRIAFRNLLRQKVYSLINVVGFALGMAACILILLWVDDELGFNSFNKNLDRIFVVPQTQHYETIGDFTVMPTPGPLSAELARNYPEIERSARYEPWFGKRKLSYGSLQFQNQIHFADQAFLGIFSFQFIAGDEATALESPNSIVLTQGMAKKMFGTADPVGKIVRMDDRIDLKVTGLITDVPRNSDVTFEGLVPTALLKEYGSDPNAWGPNMIVTYVLLKNARQYGELSKKIEGLLRSVNKSPSAGRLFLFPLKDLHLYSISGKGGRIESVYLFSLIAFFALVIACINFMNLSTARASKRATEVGMRKIAGATRLQIAKQFFGESIFLTIIALGLALIFVEILLPSFNDISGKLLMLGNISSSSIALIVGMIGLTGILSGIYPSVFMSSVNPLSILKRSVSPMTGGRSLRRLLVITQFVISISLIIATVVVSGQLRYIQDRDLGMDVTNLIYISLDKKLQENITGLKTELLRSPNIVSVSTAQHLPTQIYSNGGGWSWEGKTPNQDVLVSFTWGDYDYFNTFGMRLADGRFYSKGHSSDDSSSVIINESFARLIGGGSPVGKTITRSGQQFTIVGVVKDFNYVPLRTKIGPLAIFLDERGQFLFAKISSSDIPGALNSAQRACKNVNPTFMFESGFLDEAFGQAYTSEQRLLKILNSFAVLAIIISLLGLVGLSSYVAESKTKEVGIRKVLGATTTGMVYLLSRELIGWVLVANVIAWPITYYLMNNWLQGFAYRMQLGIWIFFFSGCLSLAIAFLTLSYQAIRAATANPVESLRYE